ncbi:MAG: DUF1573 domain-containing protein [Planctomycetota bacterium]
MSRLSRLLAGGSVFLLGFGLVVVLLVSTVTYKPYGVPDLLRDEYDQKLIEINRRAELLSSTAEVDQRPIVKVDSPMHDFGQILPHSQATHAFQISNVGFSDLALAVGETSCKCTVGKLKKGLLKPGESTTVTMTWNTGYKADDYVQTALLQTNDPLNQQVVLKIRGTVRADLVAAKSLLLTRGDIGSRSSGSMLIYSQIWDDFVIEEFESDVEGLDWYVEPAPVAEQAELVDADASCAWRLSVSVPLYKAGSHQATCKLKINPGTGEKAVSRDVKLSWETRTPIAFLGPEIHRDTGFELSTLSSAKRHEFPLLVRLRGADQRDLDILDYEPKELEVSLEPTARKGDYRLVIAIPEGCPDVTFNRDDKHGYVQVGDPNDPAFQNWMPISGAVYTEN